MSKLSAIPSGPQLANRLTGNTSLQANNDIGDQANLNATVSRIKGLRSSYDKILETASNVSDSIHGLAKNMANEASKNAQEIRGRLEKGISRSQRETSKLLSTNTDLIKASSVIGSGTGKLEIGKGLNVNLQA